MNKHNVHFKDTHTTTNTNNLLTCSKQNTNIKTQHIFTQQSHPHNSHNPINSINTINKIQKNTLHSLIGNPDRDRNIIAQQKVKKGIYKILQKEMQKSQEKNCEQKSEISINTKPKIEIERQNWEKKKIKKDICKIINFSVKQNTSIDNHVQKSAKETKEEDNQNLSVSQFGEYPLQKAKHKVENEKQQINFIKRSIFDIISEELKKEKVQSSAPKKFSYQQQTNVGKRETHTYNLKSSSSEIKQFKLKCTKQVDLKFQCFNSSLDKTDQNKFDLNSTKIQSSINSQYKTGRKSPRFLTQPEESQSYEKFKEKCKLNQLKMKRQRVYNKGKMKINYMPESQQSEEIDKFYGSLDINEIYQPNKKYSRYDNHYEHHKFPQIKMRSKTNNCERMQDYMGFNQLQTKKRYQKNTFGKNIHRLPVEYDEVMENRSNRVYSKTVDTEYICKNVHINPKVLEKTLEHLKKKQKFKYLRKAAQNLRNQVFSISLKNKIELLKHQNRSDEEDNTY